MANPRNCRHENIYWEDLFKEDKNFDNKAYCLNCGADKGRTFNRACEVWYRKKIEEWLNENGLVEKKSVNGKDYYFTLSFVNFLKKNNYDQYWNDLGREKIDPEYFESPFGQTMLFEVAKSIEYLCREFKKEKEQEKPNDPNKDNPNHRERERERAKLQSDINKLVNKPNKTSEEEDELAKLKTRLKELEDESKKPNNQPTNHSEPPTNYLPLIIVSVVVVIGLILILFLATRKKKHHKSK